MLDADGRPIDALPGLYGPQAFARGVRKAMSIHAQVAPLQEPQRSELLRSQHQDCYDAVLASWRAETGDQQALQPGEFRLASSPTPTAEQAAVRTLSKMMVEQPMLNLQGRGGAKLRSEAPSARAAGMRTVGKRQGEQPVLDALDGQPAGGWDRWQPIAARHIGDARLDTASVRLMAAKSAAGGCGPMDAGQPALAGQRLVRAFTRSVAVDTVRNEYELHARIHQWFASGAVPSDVNALNELVYAELFLTPSSDPWLGLRPDDVYSALQNDGVQAALR